MWVIGQSFINVGYVIGLLPVTGIQLPLISAGGTSTATTLFMIGMMANAARHEPEAVAALRAGRDDRMNRMLRLPLPEPYVPDPRRGAARPAAQPRARPRPAQARRSAKPARKAAARGADGSRRRGNAAGASQCIMEAANGPPSGGRPRSTAAHAHWKVSVTGERLGQQPAGGRSKRPGRRATALRSRWCSPAAAPPAMSSRRWPSPTR